MYLYVARFMLGLGGGGVFTVIPMFVSEIADTKIRGALGSLLPLTCNVGIFLVFVLGNFFSFSVVPVISLTAPILFLFLFMFFPETPQFLMKAGRTDEAERSMRFYRNINENGDGPETEAMLQSELDKLRISFNLDEKKPQIVTDGGNVVTITEQSTSMTWSDFCKKSSAGTKLLRTWNNDFFYSKSCW